MNKHAFERSVLTGIPKHEAAAFFHSIKTAGWGEPVDESGVLEGQFAAPIEAVIQQLTDVICAKFQLMLAYHIYSQSMRGVAQHACAEVFIEHAEQERAAGEAYLKRAAVLGGGPVHLGEILPPPASADPVGILMIMARAEQEGIAAQRELKAMVGEENPLAFQIEQYMVEDQHHLDELWQMLPQDVQHTPVLEGGEDPAMAAGAPEEVPPPEVGEPELPAAPAEEVPMEEEPALEEEPESLPPAAEAGPPEKKPPLKPKSDNQKEAFARGLQHILKMADIKDDILNAMSETGRAQQAIIDKTPEADRHLLAEGAVGKLRDLNKNPLEVPKAIPRHMSELDRVEALINQLNNPPPRPRAGGLSAPVDHFHAKAQGTIESLRGPETSVLSRLRGGLPLIGGAAALGAGLGGLGGATQNKAVTKSIRAAGGPINEFAADHPVAYNAGLGGLMAAGGTAGHLIGKRYGLGGAGALAGATAPLLPIAGINAALKSKEASARFRMGLLKLGFAASSMPEPGAGTDPGAAPMPDEQQAVMPQPSMAAPGPQPPMATPPGAGKYAPVNYLEAEETARRAQASNEAGFYRDKAMAAEGQAQSMGAQVQQIQQQLDQLSSQAAESQNQIMAANQEAMTANDQMLNQATLAARMRMGMQQLRAQMMEIASQDPEQLAAAAGGPTPMDVGQQAQQSQMGGAPPGDAAGAGAIDPNTGQPVAEPGAEPGTPGAAPAPDGAPGTPPGGAGLPSEGGSTSRPEEPGKSEDEKKDKGETTVSIKKAQAKLAAMGGTVGQELLGKLPYMAVGAGAGAIAGAHQGTKVQTLRGQVDALKGQQDGGFTKTLELGKAQMMLAQAEDAKKSPFRAALTGGLAGASLGAGVGSAVPWGIEGAKRLAHNVGEVRKYW